MPEDFLEIDGYRYTAINEGGDAWMVRRWPVNGDPQDYVESLIAVGSSSTEEVIGAAITRGSWA